MFELNKKDPARTDLDSKPAEERERRPIGGQPPPSAVPRGAGMAVIGRSIQIRGDLRGDEDIRIEGDIEGSIHLPNHSLTIGQEGRVRADAYAKSVIIDGEINGDVYGAECVTIRAKARVMGNILASRVSLEEGARFKGSIDMDPASVKTALEKVHGVSTDSTRSRSAEQRPIGVGSVAKRDTEKSVPAAGPAKSAKSEATL